MDIEDLPITVSVPDFGRIALGIEKYAAYEAAHRGDFPVVKIGKFLRVPVLSALKRISGSDDIGPLASRFLKMLNEEREAA